MTTRKFYRTTVELTILSEDPIPENWDISEIVGEMTDGDYSGMVSRGDSGEINGKEAALALLRQGSDPEFFQIDQDGNDVE